MGPPSRLVCEQTSSFPVSALSQESTPPATRKSHFLAVKPNPPPALAPLPRVLCLGLLRLRNLLLQHPLRHFPTLRIRIRAPRMNRIHANVENVPTTEPLG